MTTPQSELKLEKGFVEQLFLLGYDYSEAKNEEELLPDSHLLQRNSVSDEKSNSLSFGAYI